MKSANHLHPVLLLASVLISTAAQAQDNKPPSQIVSSYISTYKVSITEAKRRLALVRIASALNGRLKKEQAETFGGMFIEHVPTFHITAKFTRDGAATLARYTSDPDISASATAQTYTNLIDAQKKSYRLLKGLGYDSASFVTIKDSKVKFFVDNLSSTRSAMGKMTSSGIATLKLPSFVTVEQAKDLYSKREVSLEGGRSLSNGVCTSGFTVYNAALGTSGPKWLTTSGHCGDILSYNGTNLPVVGENWEAGTNNDYQWHSTPGFYLDDKGIYIGSATKMPVDRVAPYFLMVEGEPLCKYGAITFLTCGSIISTSYNQLGSNGFVLVHSDNNINLSDHGDSGAPWYNDDNHEGYGSHTDSSKQNTNDAVFMPIENVSESGLRVMLTLPH